MRTELRLSVGSMEGIGPDQAGKEELKRAATWRAIRRELGVGVKPQWTGELIWCARGVCPVWRVSSGQLGGPVRVSRIRSKGVRIWAQEEFVVASAD